MSGKTGKGAKAWFDRYGAIVQGMASIMAVLVAVAALYGVKVQINSAARLQQEQSARDIYREFLNLSISKPEFADPDYCAIRASKQDTAYRNYVDYLLYASEQLLSVSPDWEGAMVEHLEPHSAYLCAIGDWSDYPETVRDLVGRNKATLCASPRPACP